MREEATVAEYVETITTLLKIVDPINGEGVELAEVDNVQYVTWALIQQESVCERLWGNGAVVPCGKNEKHADHSGQFGHTYEPAPREWVRHGGDYFAWVSVPQGVQFAAAYASFKDRERQVRQSFENDAFANHVPAQA